MRAPIAFLFISLLLVLQCKADNWVCACRIGESPPERRNQLLVLQCKADNWVCPNPKDDFCDSYHAEYLADQADKKLNEVYKKLISDYPEKATKKEIEFTKVAQRAWLKYSEAHCAAILNKFAGASFTKAEMEHSCRLEQINKRIKELESYCESCNQPSPKPSLKH